MKRKFIGHTVCIAALIAGLFLFGFTGPSYGFSLSGVPGKTEIEDMEKLLPDTVGRERFNLLTRFVDYYFKDEPDRTILYGQEALELLKKHPDARKELDLSIKLGIVCSEAGKTEQAAGFLDRAKRLMPTAGTPRHRADILFLQGDINRNTGEPAKALEFYEQAGKLYETLDARASLAAVYNNSGLTYWEMGDYPLVLDSYVKAAKIYDQLGDHRKNAYLHNNFGRVYWALNRYDLSLEYYFKALDYFKKTRDRAGLAKVYNNIAVIFKLRKNLDKALIYMEKSLEIKKKLGNPSLIGVTINNFGDLYEAKGDFWRAESYYIRAARIFKETKRSRYLAVTFSNLGSINRKMKRFDSAVSYFEQAIEIGKKIKARLVLQDSYQYLSQTYEDRGEYKKALHYYRLYKKSYDALYNEKNLERIQAIEKGYQIVKKEKEIALLKKESEIKELELSRERGINQSRQIMQVVVAVLLFILAVLVYMRHRLKSKINRALHKEIEVRKLAEKKFRDLSEKSVIGICIIQDNIIKYANPRFLEYFRLPLREVVGLASLDLVAPEDRDDFSRNLQQRKTGTTDVVPFEFRGISHGGEYIHLEARGTLTTYDGQPAVLETMIDVSDRKRAETELLKSRKLESLGILAGGITHDFNNLLTVIIGNLSLLRDSIDDPQMEAEPLVDQVESAATQAAELVKNFITLSEGAWIVAREIDFNELFSALGQYELKSKDIRYTLSLPSDLSPVYGDQRQLRQVMANLLTNADEAVTGPVKRISVTGSNASLDGGNPWKLTPGDYVKITIKDNGKGVPPDMMEKIFDPYFSTKERGARKGMGLGLAICLAVVKKHKGHIEITSEHRQGTSVEVYLPVMNPDEPITL